MTKVSGQNQDAGDGSFYVYDLLSLTGVQVNETPIPLRRALSHNDELVIGHTRLWFIDPSTRDPLTFPEGFVIIRRPSPGRG